MTWLGSLWAVREIRRESALQGPEFLALWYGVHGVLKYPDFVSSFVKGSFSIDLNVLMLCEPVHPEVALTFLQRWKSLLSQQNFFCCC